MANSTDKIYADLKKRIIELSLAPNILIKEEALCSEYNVSRSPIRYVISRLVQEGLLIVKPKKGTYVSKISYKGIQNDTFIRNSVESTVIKECCLKITDEDKKVLKDILEEQENICKLEPSIQKSQLFNAYDNKFHATIFKIAGYESLWERLCSLTINYDRVRVVSNLRSKEDVFTTYKYHCSIYDNICANKVKDAVDYFQKHLTLAFNKFETIVQKYEDYFDKE